MTDKKLIIHKRDGFWLEWFSRRSTLDVNIYIQNADGTRGKLVSELQYPKIRGLGPDDWEPEAVHIAKKNAVEAEQA
jgi:hypothetical protein